MVHLEKFRSFILYTHVKKFYQLNFDVVVLCSNECLESILIIVPIIENQQASQIIKLLKENCLNHHLNFMINMDNSNNKQKLSVKIAIINIFLRH